MTFARSFDSSSEGQGVIDHDRQTDLGSELRNRLSGRRAARHGNRDPGVRNLPRFLLHIRAYCICAYYHCRVPGQTKRIFDLLTDKKNIQVGCETEPVSTFLFRIRFFVRGTDGKLGAFWGHDDFREKAKNRKNSDSL